MAGYFKKLDGHVYEGSFAAGEAMENGVFAELVTANGATVVKKITAAGSLELRVDEKTTLWGKEAIVATVTNPGTGVVYMVENEWIDDYMPNYNNAEYTCKVGDLVRMRRPVLNDQIIVTVEKTLYDALAVGDIVKPAAGGSVAKKA